MGHNALNGTALYENLPDGLIYAGRVAYKYKGIMPANSSIEIKDGTISITARAFSDCTGLTNITIPSSVSHFGFGAFYNCTGLKKVIVPNFDVSKWCSIGFGDVMVGNSGTNPLEYAHHLYSDENTEITNIIIPEGVTAIYSHTFYGCIALESVAIPNTTKEIWHGAFYGCTGLGSVVIPEGFTFLGEYAFKNCSALTSITMPSSITSWGVGRENYANIFEGCPITNITINNNVVIAKLTSFFGTKVEKCVLGNNITDIPANTFSSFINLTNITIPASIKTIGEKAFSGCIGLTDIVIPSNVKSIGEKAFSGCSGLTSINIPNSVTSIGERAFLGCSKLTSIYSYIESPTSDTGSNFESSHYTNVTLYVPFGTKDKYLATDGWKNFAKIVEMSIEPIEEETVMEFNDKDYIVDDTPVDLNSTIINDMYISMDNKSDVANPDGFYDSTEKCIVINKATSASAIETAVASDLGSSDFINNYTGIVIEVNGKGIVKINAQSAGNNKLAVKIGSADAMTYTLASKGDVTINYDVTENTYVYIYAVDADNQQQSLSMDITDTSDNAVKVYSVTVTPDATAIETVTETDIPAAVFGKIYSIDGKQFSQPQKGLNILKMSDGTTRKIVVQ